MKLQNGNYRLIHEVLNQTLLENNHNNWELPNGEFFNLKKHRYGFTFVKWQQNGYA